MKDAQTMYTITEEAKTKLKQKIAINTITTALAGLIETEANKGMTYVKVATGFLPFDENFPITITNLNLVVEHVRTFGYKAHVLLTQRTNEMVFHIDWTPSPMDILFKDFGSILDPEGRF